MKSAGLFGSIPMDRPSLEREIRILRRRAIQSESSSSTRSGHRRPCPITLRVCGIYNHIEVENDASDITADSGHVLRWEMGAGRQVDLGSNWGLRPQLGYRALSRDIEIESVTTEADLNHFGAGAGIAKSF